MNLRILTPTEVLLEAEVHQVNAEAQNGAFGLMPHHIDFVTALVPSILSYQPESGGDEQFIAIDEGILVKCGDVTLVSVRSAIPGENLDTLQHTVAERFIQLDEPEAQSRAAIARLEAGFMRGFLQGYIQ